MPAEKAIDKISEAGRAVLFGGFATGRTAAFLAQALVDATGEEMAERTIAREASIWRANLESQKALYAEKAALVKAMKDQGVDGAEMIQVLATNHLIEHPEEFTGADPIRLQRTQLEAMKARQRERALDIMERKVAADERKMTLLEDKEKRAIAALTEQGEGVTEETRAAKVREILGLTA